jgi:glycosyltransferase involved in cell wall biosynthesis
VERPDRRRRKQTIGPREVVTMNIAMVCVTASPVTASKRLSDGLSTHVAELACALGRGGHRVTVYTRRGDENARARARLGPGVSVVRLRAGPGHRLSEDDLLSHLTEFVDGLARCWRARRPDVLHAHDWVSGLAALYSADGLRIPIVQSFHTLGSLRRRAGQPCPAARIRMEKAIGQNVPAVIATSESQYAELVRLGVPRSRLTMVPSGVDVQRFTPDGPAFPRGPVRRLVTLSQPAERQSVATVIRTLAHVPDAELMVAGGPPREELDGDQVMHRIRMVAKEAHVADRVTFLGQVSPSDAAKLLRSADLTVSLPAYETSGRVPLESMACGTPVVASAVGGHLDSVIDDVTGIHVPAGRPVEAARRIRALLDDQTQRAALGIGAVDRARSRYSWERVAAETVKVYETARP